MVSINSLIKGKYVVSVVTLIKRKKKYLHNFNLIRWSNIIVAIFKLLKLKIFRSIFSMIFFIINCVYWYRDGGNCYFPVIIWHLKLKIMRDYGFLIINNNFKQLTWTFNNLIRSKQIVR